MLVTVKHLYSVYWPYIIEIMLTQVSAYNVHRNFFFFYYYAPPVGKGQLALLLSVRLPVRLSVAYITNNPKA